MTKTMTEVFDSLPRTDREVIIEHLAHAISWLGWDQKMANHATEYLILIRNVFYKNGHEIEEYT